MPKAVLLILGCAAINYSLRAMPFFTRTIRELPPYVKRFLDYMPIAALGALILPGIFTSFPQKPMAGVAGVAAAAIAAWFARGLVIPVFASIAVTWLVLQYSYSEPTPPPPTPEIAATPGPVLPRQATVGNPR
jgi:branched-subunit amino acid transport protein